MPENFFEQLGKIKGEQARLAFAKAHAQESLGGVLDGEWIVPEQGMQNFVFINDDQIVRVARSPEVSKFMAQEVKILQALHDKNDTSVQTPSVIDYCPEQHVMRLSFLPGEPLSAWQLMVLPKEQQNSIAARLGEFIAVMHSVFPESKKIDVVWRDDVLQGINERLARERRTSTRQWLEASAECAKNYGINDGPYFVSHTDLNDSNILFDPKADALSVIDFTSAKYAPSYRDFVKLRSVFPPHFVKTVIDVYEKKANITVAKDMIGPFQGVYKIYCSLPESLPPAGSSPQPPPRRQARYNPPTNERH